MLKNVGWGLGGPIYSLFSWVQSIKHKLARGWRPDSEKGCQEASTVPIIEPKYIHIPTNAAVSHLRTTANSNMARANEVL